MKITIVTGPWLPVPALQGGSVPRLWQGLAEVFAAKGHDVKILAKAYKEQPQSEILNGVQYIRRGGFSQSRRIIFDLMKDLVYAFSVAPLLPRADVLVINDFWIPLLAQWLRTDAGRIVINVNRFPKRQLFLYGGVARLAAASTAVEEAIIEQCPWNASKVRVFPNPIDTRIFSPPAAPRPDRDGKTILYVGRIHPEKGLDLLIHAFAMLESELPQATLKIMGPVREDQGGGGVNYFRTLQSKTGGLRVQFLDPVFEPARLADVYRAADLFCYPSLAERGESFGVAPLEAMATGLVPIVSDLKCFRDFIDEGKTGYYFNHRGTDAARNLSVVLRAGLRNQARTSQISSTAVRRAGNFSYERVADLYLEDFAELLLTTPSREFSRTTETAAEQAHQLSQSSRISRLDSKG